MSPYHIALLSAAIVTGLISRDLRRAWLWIGALALSFIVSVAYLYAPKPFIFGGWWPPASGVAALCDISVALAIYTWGRRRWETVGLYALMLLSVAVNALYTTGQIFGWPPIPPHEVYAIILELINYAALLLIAGTAILSRIGAVHGRSFAGRLMASLYSARSALRKEHRPSEALRKRS